MASQEEGILGFDPEALLLATLLAIKVMLCERGWSNENDVVKSSDLTKRVSVWHKMTLDPLVKLVTEQHRMPQFALNATYRHPEDGCPMTLHIQLLTKASKEILESCTPTVGRQTWKKVKEWFYFVNIARESELYSRVTDDDVRKEFARCMLKFDRLSRIYDGEENVAGTEFQFFDPTSTFIRVAHMVYFYTKSEEKDRPPSIRSARISVTADKMLLWESISGGLFLDTIIPAQRGLQVAEMQVIPTIRFSLMALPYSELCQNLTKTIRGSTDRGIPSIIDLQESVANAMLGAIDDLCLQRPPTLALNLKIDCLEEWLAFCYASNDNSRKNLQNSEKQRTHYRQHRDSRGDYTPKPPKKFQRDIYVTGDESYYYNFLITVGRGRQRFRIHLTRRRARRRA